MGRGEEIPSETQQWVNSLRIKIIFFSTRAEHKKKKKKANIQAELFFTELLASGASQCNYT